KPYNITWEIQSAIPQDPPSVSITLLLGAKNSSRFISNIATDISVTDKIYLWNPQDASLANGTYTVRIYEPQSAPKVDGSSKSFTIINTKNTSVITTSSFGGNNPANTATSSPASTSGKPNILNVGPKIQPYISTVFLLIITIILASFYSLQ
ncbi:5591_t:CDS:2, partial [Ambispora gerdemannii]